MKGKTTNQIETLDVNKTYKELITYYEKEAGDIFYKMEEEIKKAIIDLHDQCKMNSLTEQTLETAYANMAKFFENYFGVRYGLEYLMKYQKTNYEDSAKSCMIFEADFLLLQVLDDRNGKPKPQNLDKYWSNTINLKPILLDFDRKDADKVVEDWLDSCKETLQDDKTIYLPTMKIRSLIIRINKLKKGLGRLKKLYAIKSRIDNVDKVFQP